MTTLAKSDSREFSLTDDCYFLQATLNTLLDSDEDLTDVELIKSLNGQKCKNILSFVEDSVADTLPVSNWSGTLSKNKRKSLAEVSLPYGANDKETLAWKQRQITQNCASKRRKSTVGCGGTNGLSKQMFELGESSKKSMFRDILSFVSPTNTSKKLKSPIHNKFGQQKTGFAAIARLPPSTPKQGIKSQVKAGTGPESRLLKLQSNDTVSSSSDCEMVTEEQQNVRNSISAITGRLADEEPCNISGETNHQSDN